MEHVLDAEAVKAISALTDRAQKAEQKVLFFQAYQTEEKEFAFVCQGAGQPAEVREFTRPRPALKLAVKSLNSFVDLFTSLQGVNIGPGAIWVTDRNIEARYNELKHTERHTVTLDLKRAPAYQALLKLCTGLPQRDAWELLETDLHGTINEGLSLLLSTLRCRALRDSAITIQPTGVTSKAKTESVEVTYQDKNGEQSIVVPTSWRYDGPFLECHGETISLECRLLLEHIDGDLMVRLVPRNRPVIEAQWFEALVDYLRDQLGGALIYY